LMMNILSSPRGASFTAFHLKLRHLNPVKHDCAILELKVNSHKSTVVSTTHPKCGKYE
jgi:hypothetical protein